MGNVLKLVVVGNCQARPLADSLARSLSNACRVDTVIVHLQQMTDGGNAERLFASADFILSQYIQDSYPMQHVRTGKIKERYSDKLIIWPNIFFKGQTPDLVYARSDNRARVIGPLGEYQSRGILEQWQIGQTVENTERYLLDDLVNSDKDRAVAELSLIELARRDSVSEVKIAQYVDERWRDNWLFFTFNHPRAELIHVVAKQILALLDVPHALVTNSQREPLDRVIPPLFPSSIRSLCLRLPVRLMTKGFALEQKSSGLVLSPNVVYYNLKDLIEASFFSLDLQCANKGDIKFS